MGNSIPFLHKTIVFYNICYVIVCDSKHARPHKTILILVWNVQKFNVILPGLFLYPLGPSVL